MNLLNNFSNNKSTKTLFLIDILYMRDINAVYGFKNGDLIIKQLGNLLKTLLKDELAKLLSHSLNKKVTYNLKKNMQIFFP